MSDPRPLHRFFSLSWVDYCEDSLVIEAEMDLSLKKQLVDLVLIRRGTEPIPRKLPDGFDELATHNLVTFKSHQEALDGWALSELVAHYVNYRKQVSPSLQNLLAESDFRLFAVSVRSPQQLLKQVRWVKLRAGVYDVEVGVLRVRVVVIHELPLEEHNAMFHLFSAKEDLLRYGQQHYRPRSRDTSTLLYELFSIYREDPEMADQRLQEFFRESLDKILKSLTPEQRLKGLSPEERLKDLTAEEVLKALPPDTVAAIAQQLKSNGSASKPE